MKKFLLLLLFLILPSLAHAQETIVSYDNNSLPVLNEELRKSASGLRNTKSLVTTLQSDVDSLTNNIKVGSFTRALNAVDVQSISVGFRPRVVFIFAGVNNSIAYSSGVADNTSNFSQYNRQYSGDGYGGMSVSKAIELWGASYYITGTVSITDDGFTITWANEWASSTATATMFYIAI